MQFAHNLGLIPSGPPKPDTTNAEGKPAFSETLKQSIARVAFTGVLADSFYGKELTQTKEFIPLCVQCAVADPRFLLNAAKVSRTANFKLFPKIALGALISKCGAESWKAIEDDVVGILRTYNAGQLLELALVFKSKEFGTGLGSRPQRILGRAMTSMTAQRLEDMTLSDRSDVRRLLRLLHPRAFTPEQSKIVTYALGDTPKAQTERQTAIEALKSGFWDQAKTIRDFKLPFNATKGLANSDKATWQAIREGMSPLQLLLNLRALDERGVIDPALLEATLNEVDLTKTRLVPHDILRPLGMAYEMRGSNVMKYREVLTKFLARLASVPVAGLDGKRVGVLLDFSGSMAPGYGQNSLGNWILAVTLATPIMAAAPDRHLAFFGFEACFEGQAIPAKDYGFQGRTSGASFAYLKGCPAEAAFHNLLGMRPDQGTDVAKGIQLFHTNNIVLDVLYLFTDEQQNGNMSGLVAWNQYRNLINPKAKLVIVNVSNTKWHLAKETDPSVNIIQAVTPLIFKQFGNFNQSSVQMIEHWHEQAN